MAKVVDARDLKSLGATHDSSSLSERTSNIMRKKYTQYLGQRGYKVQLPELVWIFDKMPTKYERKVIKKLKLYGYGIIWCEVTKVQQ